MKCMIVENTQSLFYLCWCGESVVSFFLNQTQINFFKTIKITISIYLKEIK